MITEKTASRLGPGDVILHPDFKLPDLLVCRGGCYTPMQVKVTILRAPEAARDVTGMLVVRCWARREDTGAEGYVTYGPAAQVPMAAAVK